MIVPPSRSTLFPYTTLFRSGQRTDPHAAADLAPEEERGELLGLDERPPAEAGVPPNRLAAARSEEHTSELQSRVELVCRLLLGTKKHPQCGARCRRLPRQMA